MGVGDIGGMGDIVGDTDGELGIWMVAGNINMDGNGMDIDRSGDQDGGGGYGIFFKMGVGTKGGKVQKMGVKLARLGFEPKTTGFRSDALID